VFNAVHKETAKLWNIYAYTYEYVYSPVKAEYIHRDIKVYKIDRGQNYTEKNYIELTKQS